MYSRLSTVEQFKLNKRRLEDEEYKNLSNEDYLLHLVKETLRATPRKDLFSETIGKATRKNMSKMWMENFAMNLGLNHLFDPNQWMMEMDRQVEEYGGLEKAIRDRWQPTIPQDLREKNSIWNIPKRDKQPSLCVAAGPSVREHHHVEQLARHGNWNGPIIACDRMLKPLLDAGVSPESGYDLMVATVDGHRTLIPLMYRDIRDLNIPCFMATTASPYTVREARKAGIDLHWFHGLMDDFYTNDSVCGAMEAMIKFPGISCLAEGSLVYTENGRPVPIEQVRPGNRIYGVDEAFRLKEGVVTAVHDNGLRDVFNLKTNRRNIVATKEHRFVVLRSQSTPYFKLDEEGRMLLEARRKALNLLQKDVADKAGISKSRYHKIKTAYRGVPLPVLERISSTLNLNLKEHYVKCYEKETWSDKELKWVRMSEIKEGDAILSLESLPPRESINQKTEFLQLLGMYAGDGSINYNPDNRKYSVVLSLPDETGVQGDYARLFEEVYDAEATVYDHRVEINSKQFVKDLIRLGFNHRSRDKQIPQWLWSLNDSSKVAFLSGLFDADGSLNGSTSLSLELGNRKLVEQARAMAIQLGLHVDNVYSRRRDISINNGYKDYVYNNYETHRFRLSGVGLNDRLQLYRPNLKDNLQDPTKDVSFASLMKGITLSNHLYLESVVSIEPAGKRRVYDLTTTLDSYIAEGLVVHNSGGNVGAATFTLSCYIWAMPVVYIGLDLGYTPETRVEDTEYWSMALSYDSNTQVDQLMQLCFRGHNPDFGVDYWQDPVFHYYRDAIFELIHQREEEWRIMKGANGVHKPEVFNASEGGSVHHPEYITGITFQEALERWG